MPGGDKTGPLGYGPRTGRGMGPCSAFVVPGYMNPGGYWGRGYARRGWGGRGGRGFRWSLALPEVYPVYPTYYQPNISAESEKEYLNRQIELLEDRLQWLKKRVDDVEEQSKAVE